MSAISFTEPAVTEEDATHQLQNDVGQEGITAGIQHHPPVAAAGEGVVGDDDDDDAHLLQNNNNNNNNENDNNNNINDDEDEDGDISAELLEAFELELDLIPESEKLDYTAALIDCDPTVFETDSDPKRFLRAQDYDPEKAARCLVKYWEMRCDIFLDDAYKSMTSISDDGAISTSVADQMLYVSTFLRILPNDAEGHTVICSDKTNISFKEIDQSVLVKMLWFIMHKALQDKPMSTQKKGIVFITINRKFELDFPKRQLLKQFVMSVSEYLPVKLKNTHIVSSSIHSKMTVPLIKLFLTSEQKKRIQLHTRAGMSDSTLSIINSMSKFGLSSNNLPKSIGGTYNEKPTWVRECEHQRHHRRANNNRRQRTSSGNNISGENEDEVLLPVRSR